MDDLVTLLFLTLWIIVAFFVLRYAGRRYFHEPRRADAAAAGIAVAFALGTLWPYAARPGRPPVSAPVPAAATAAPAAQTVDAPVLGNGKPPGTHDVSAMCRSARGPFGTGVDGSIDYLRPDAAHSTLVASGGSVDGKAQYLVEGWAAEAAAGRPALWVCLVIDGKIEARARVYFGVPRADLVSSFHHDELAPSGYTIAIGPRLLSRGTHLIQVVAKTAGGKLMMLPSDRNVTVY
jgi:hypothetical protein